jgi:hypothetical protein
VGIAGGLNLYAYCAGSPLSRVDLRGLGCKVHGDKDDPDCEDCDNREKTKKANEQTTDAPDPAAFGEALGESVKKMPKGKTAAICDGISNSGMSQQDAATAADAASRVAFGGTGGVAQVGDDMVVLPSIIGADRPVLVVAPNGTVQSGSADVRPATPAEMASGGNILVASNVKKR